MDESAALRAFQDALRTQRPEFGQFSWPACWAWTSATPTASA